MTSVRLHELEAYPEFKTKRGIEQVKRYVEGVMSKDPNPRIPRKLDDKQRKRWIAKYSRNFVIEDGKLFYNPKNKQGKARLKLEVVLPKDRQKDLKEIYDDEREGMEGENNFYYQVMSHDLNIPRDICENYLKKQTIYEVTRHFDKVPKHPILAKVPNERWQCDCVYMHKYGRPNDVTSFNNHYEDNVEHEKPIRVTRRGSQNMNSYIAFMTVVDCFSNKVWIEPLLNIDSENTSRALARIFVRSKTFPRIIQSDNGPEFKLHFDQMLRDHNEHHPVNKITHVFGSAHTSQSNGKVERMNRTIRGKISELIVRNGNVEWVSHLREVEDSINNNRVTGEKFTPNEMWRPGYFAPDGDYTDPDLNDTSTKQQIIRHRQQNLIERAARNVENNGGQLEINDLVRVPLEVIDSAFRARAHGFEKKYNSVIYSPQLYRVVKVYPAQRVATALRKLGNQTYDVSQMFYALREYPGNKYVRKRFARSELIKCGTVHSKPVPIAKYDLDQEKADQLNLFTNPDEAK